MATSLQTNQPARAAPACAVRAARAAASAAVFAVIAALAAAPAAADVVTWSGTSGVNGNWGLASNWAGGVGPATGGGATDSLVFAGALQRMTNNNRTAANSQYIGISFAAGAGAFTHSGNALTIGSGGLTNGSIRLQTFNTAITVRGDQTWDGGTGGMAINGRVSGGVINNTVLTLQNKVAVNNAASAFTVGDENDATLNLLSGSTLVSASGRVGGGSGASHATVSGSGSKWTSTGSLQVGTLTGYYLGSTLSVLDGGQVSSGDAIVGASPVGRSSATVSGAGSGWSAAGLALAQGGDGLLEVLAGASLKTTGLSQLGVSGGRTGTLNLDGAGSSWVAAAVQVGSGGAAVLNISNGARLSSTDTVLVNGGGTVNLSTGAALQAAALQINGGTVNVYAGFDWSGLGNVGVGAGGTLSHAGSVTFAGAFTNDGLITAAGGNGTLTFLGNVDGGGSYAGNVTFAAGYGPGHSPAAVSFGQGDVNFTADALLTMEVFGAGAGEFDQLLDIDDLNFLGHLALVFGPGFSSPGGATLKLFGFNQLTTAFDVGRITVTGLGLSRLDFSRLGIDGTLGVLGDGSTVPEPGSWALSLLALGLAARARRGCQVA